MTFLPAPKVLQYQTISVQGKSLYNDDIIAAKRKLRPLGRSRGTAGPHVIEAWRRFTAGSQAASLKAQAEGHKLLGIRV